MRRPPTDRSRSSVDAQGGRRGIRWSRRSGLGRAVFAVLVVILLTASSFAAVVLLPGARPPATSSSHSTSSAAVSSTTGSEVTSSSSSTVRGVQYQPVFRASVGWIDTDAEGRYNITLPYSGPTKGVDVDATGYLHAISYVSVEPGQKVPFDWYLTRSSIVSGRVLLPDGTPVAGVEVSLRTSSGETVEMGGRTPTWTSSDGRFVFDTNVAPGTYHLFVWALGTRYLAPWWDVVEEHPDYLPGTLCTSGSDFTVADHSLKDVTIQVPYSAAVVGRVTDAYGHPAANVHVMAIKTS